MIKIPGKILAHPQLTAVDKLIFGVVYTGGEARVTYEQFAEMLNINRMTARNSTKRLATLGLLKAERHPVKPTDYTLTNGGDYE